MVEADGLQRARYLMLRLLARAKEQHVALPALTTTDYINTIPTESRAVLPRRRGDRAALPRLDPLERGDDGAPRAAARDSASAATSRPTPRRPACTRSASTTSGAARTIPAAATSVFFQGHASPGMYARAFLEGRLSEHDLDGFRQEVSHPGGGIPSYPHPRLMPDFWEFPTVSMGLGPMNAIQQARVNRYLHHRGIKDTSDQHVWAFLGDGELDEVESRGLIHVAAIDGLDNLTFVINCNLQRLDGPVRGNGKIIQELEAFFRGAGWNVIKVVWGRDWDKLLQADRDGALVNLMNTTADGDFQTYRANDGAYIREHFFGRDPRTKQMVADMTDEEIWRLRRGGHDYQQGLRGLPRGDPAQGPADGDPGEDDQGLRPRAVVPGPQRDAPDEEDDAAEPEGIPGQPAAADQRRRSSRPTSYQPPYYNPATGQRGDRAT